MKDAKFILFPKTDKVSPAYVSGGKVVNKRTPAMAGALNRVGTGTYKTGDGDFGTTVRPGALDHQKYRSLENRGAVVYQDRGHL